MMESCARRNTPFLRETGTASCLVSRPSSVWYTRYNNPRSIMNLIDAVLPAGKTTFLCMVKPLTQIIRLALQLLYIGYWHLQLFNSRYGHWSRGLPSASALARVVTALTSSMLFEFDANWTLLTITSHVGASVHKHGSLPETYGVSMSTKAISALFTVPSSMR